jgi:subtilase family serine protease
VIRKLSVLLLTIVAMVAGACLVSQAHPQTLLTHHVREVTQNGQAPSVGRLPATQTMHFDIVLPLRDRAGLQSFLQDLYTPSSAFYRHFLTPQEFIARFGASQADYDSVVNFAKASGFTVVGGVHEGSDVQLTGSVKSIEAAFHITLGLYHDPIANRDFYAPNQEPTVDLPFQLWHISGLDNYAPPKPMYAKNPTPGVKSQATTGSCPGASFCGSDIRAAYYGGTALTGAGQTLGLLEYAGFNIIDVNTYYTNAHQTLNVPIVGVSVDGTPILCTYPDCDDTEQTIDITQAAGMAPDLTTIYVYVGSTDTALLSGMATHNPLNYQLSASWVWDVNPEGDDPYFEQYAAQGQNYFQAAGDDGKFNANYYTWPCTAAYVTSVGGTDLETQSAGGPWLSETVWNLGGGGYWAPDDILIPTWQQLPGVITAANEGSTIYRNAPDVSGNSNYTYYVCADQGKAGPCSENEYGGTSFAAPSWAGYLALTNEQYEANGDGTSLGFINPAIYAIGVGSGYNTAFHDITVGSNGFPATTGYDLASGWGSPNTTGLINALAPSGVSSFTLSANPSSITVAAGSAGTSTITAAISGGFNAAITLSASAEGFTFSPNPIPAPGSGTSKATFHVEKTVKAGVHVITITGKGDNITETTTLTVTITN